MRGFRASLIASLATATLLFADTSEMVLEPGWNLLSFPVANAKTGGFPEGASAYRYVLGDWKRERNITSEAFNTGEGFWIKNETDAPMTIQAEGEKYETNLDIGVGWHIVGFSESVESNLTLPEPFTIEKSWGYKPSTGWEEDVERFEPGRGYWVRLGAKEGFEDVIEYVEHEQVPYPYSAMKTYYFKSQGREVTRISSDPEQTGFDEAIIIHDRASGTTLTYLFKDGLLLEFIEPSGKRMRVIKTLGLSAEVMYFDSDGSPLTCPMVEDRSCNTFAIADGVNTYCDAQLGRTTSHQRGIQEYVPPGFTLKNAFMAIDGVMCGAGLATSATGFGLVLASASCASFMDELYESVKVKKEEDFTRKVVDAAKVGVDYTSNGRDCGQSILSAIQQGKVSKVNIGIGAVGCMNAGLSMIGLRMKRSGGQFWYEDAPVHTGSREEGGFKNVFNVIQYTYDYDSPEKKKLTRACMATDMMWVDNKTFELEFSPGKIYGSDIVPGQDEDACGLRNPIMPFYDMEYGFFTKERAYFCDYPRNGTFEQPEPYSVRYDETEQKSVLFNVVYDNDLETGEPQYTEEYYQIYWNWK